MTFLCGLMIVKSAAQKWFIYYNKTYRIYFDRYNEIRLVIQLNLEKLKHWVQAYF